MKKISKVLSVMLSVIFCLQTTTLGIKVFAENIASDGLVQTQSSTGSTIKEIDVANPKETPIVGEIKDLRDENTKHFRHKDGTFTAAVYSEPVHYEASNGEWKDIDNTLVLNNNKKNEAGKATYTPKASGLDVRIPQDFSNSQKLTITKNGYTVGMGVKLSTDSSKITESTLSSVKAQINNDYESVSSIERTVSSESEVATVETQNAEMLQLDNKVSAVNYNKLLNGADLQYVITSSKVKENIIVNSVKNEYVYQFELDLDGLIAVEQSNGSIELFENKEDKESLFTIEAPYMYDANNEISHDVEMVLKGNVLTVVANPEWINATERDFPVTIDPSISVTPSVVEDVTVYSDVGFSSNNYNTNGYLYVGKNLSGVRRTYFKFNLPVIPTGSVITNSELRLVQYDVDLCFNDKYFYAVDLRNQSSWDADTITWNNQPLSSGSNVPLDDMSINKIDCKQIVESDNYVYSLNLTTVVKNWYEGANNNGIALLSSREHENGKITLYSSEYELSSEKHPSITIQYSNNVGIEDYWSYETYNLGHKGTVYANPYNGSLTYIRNDVNMSGKLLPINISHVYNSNADSTRSEVYSGMSVGKNFYLNIQEVLVEIPTTDSLYLAGYRYKHYDGDGTIHYYIEDSTGAVSHEYNPTITATKYTQNNVRNYKLKDSSGNEKHFNSKGQLYKMVDSKGNTQTITFDGNKITEVTDPVGRKVTLTYSNLGLLTSITDSRGRVTRYTYLGRDENAKLSVIIPPERISTRFSIADENGFRINDSNSNRILWAECSEKPLRGTRVEKILSNKDGLSGQTVTTMFKYTVENDSGVASGNTIVYKFNGNVDYSDDESIFDDAKERDTYLFDTFGRVISITNKEYQTQYSVYGSDAVQASASFNKLMDSSELLTITNNMLKDHGFEYANSAWFNNSQNSTNGTVTYSTGNSSNGNKSLKLKSTSNTGALEKCQYVTLESGETYTFSVDIYIPEKLDVEESSGVDFGLTYTQNGVWKTDRSQWITSTSGWERFSQTITIPEGTIANSHAFMQIMSAEGEVYFDNVQLEKSGGARAYNLIENSDFSNYTGKNAYAWTMQGVVSDVDGAIYDDAIGRSVVGMVGSTDHNKEIYQEVKLNAQAGEVLIVGGKAAAYAVQGEENKSLFDIYVELRIKDSTDVEIYRINFDKRVIQERQVVAAYIPITRDCESAIFCFRYHQQMNSVSFDNAFMYLANYGEHYKYTPNGLISQVSNDEGKTVDYTYKINNPTKLNTVTQTVSGVTQTIAKDIVYNGNEIESLVNNEGARIEYDSIMRCYEIDSNNTTEIAVDRVIMKSPDNVSLLLSEIEYTKDGNYIASITDDKGKKISYTYDEVNDIVVSGLVRSVTDAKGNVTNYTYDPNTDELKSVSGNASSDATSTVMFSYDDHNLSSISKNGMSYNYSYGLNDRLNKIDISAFSSYISNIYDDDGNLSRISYGNGSWCDLLYDDMGNLTGEKWNGDQATEYYYNENDRLSKFVDKTTSISYQYDYAFYDLPFKITGSDGTVTKYDYDKSGILSHLTFSEDNDTIYSARYTTDEKGRPETATLHTMNNLMLQYKYDSFGRLTGFSTENFNSKVDYVNENDTKTTNRVYKYTNAIQSQETSREYSYTYTYDPAGNITNIVDSKIEYELDTGTDNVVSSTVENSSTYGYDGLNRLITETNAAGTFNYNYDIYGNITSVTKNSASGVETVHTYAYEYPGASDLLTSVDGKSITYDSFGNPYDFGEYDFQWARGKQLVRFSGNGKDIQYVYDASGKRIKQIVNGVEYNYLYSGDLLMRQTDGDNNKIDFQYGPNDALVGFKYNGTPYFYWYNKHGDVVAVVDESGNIAAEYSYDAWGNILSYSGAMASINPIRYRGYYQDPETGWYYLKTRYYNPDWRRFLNSDTTVIAGTDVINGSNIFAYCNNNPLRYIDSDGKAPVDWDSFFKSIEEPLWYTSKTVAEMLSPITNGIVKDISDYLLGEIKTAIDAPGGNFAVTTGMKIVTGGLSIGAYLLGLIPSGSAKLFDYKTGLRHLIPIDLSFAAPWAGYLLGFEEIAPGNYTSVPGKEMWQSKVGYTPIYDFFFSVGGPIFRQMYEFENEIYDSNLSPWMPDKEYYVVWIWKGDYWNLGAGAEIGIYTTKCPVYGHNVFYSVDENLTLDVDMKIDYEGETISHIQQNNWWVCSFTPEVQLPNIDCLDVSLKVKFNNDSRWESFYAKRDRNLNTTNEWTEVSLADSEYKNKSPGHVAHKCGNSYPLACNCRYTCCENPCGYLSDSGYEFYINY